ncbi:hypothetical protein BDA96_08G134100 [Sorghum bicolor]|uniref:Uncharacterized protein n=1 Tax=Sorghum bicolor TaxID=4558 RepID=A0A921U7G6_SORBI|nr:hypothetical protein BDA96_08G134100 [Sorghum bicolor]
MDNAPSTPPPLLPPYPRHALQLCRCPSPMGRTSTCSSSTYRRPGAQIQMRGCRRRVFVGEAQAEGEVVVRFPSRPCTATARVRLIPPSPPTLEASSAGLQPCCNPGRG